MEGVFAAGRMIMIDELNLDIIVCMILRMVWYYTIFPHIGIISCRFSDLRWSIYAIIYDGLY